MVSRLPTPASAAACLVSFALLGWVAAETSAPLPALTRRAVVGAPLDAPVEGGPPRARSSDAFDVPPTGVVTVPFEALAFDAYDPPELRGQDAEPLALEEFPPAAVRLEGREIEIEGFPLVTSFTGDGAERLLLTRFPPGCCFGNVPVVDEWVAVDLGEDRIDPGTGYDPIRLRGVLRVGEALDEGGFVESLYRLEGAGPAD